ncbi:hypothetical protein BCR36DRAFT_295428, partial [Piromyces finnis]
NKNGSIIEACNINNFKDKKCQTRKCAVNEDCFSGLCQESCCITNPDNILYDCYRDS